MAGPRLAGALNPLFAPALAPPSDTTSWLDEINRYRAAAGLSPVSDNPAWDLGLEHHLTYLEKTPKSYETGQYASAHTENPASPYYTADGAQEAASSDLVQGGATSQLAAIDVWLQAPFHAIGMLRSALTQVALAVDPKTGYAGLDVASGLDPNAPPATSPILFPGQGVTTNLTSFGGEYPDPRETCGWQHDTGVGLPLIALLPSAAPAGTTATLTGPGAAETTADGQLCLVDENTFKTSDPIYGTTGSEILAGDNAVLLLPRHQLAGGTYTATIHQPQQPDISWSFIVKTPPPPTVPPCSLCVTAKQPVALGVSRTLRAHRPFGIIAACFRTCGAHLSVTSPNGRVLWSWSGTLPRGDWFFTVRVPAGQSGRSVKVDIVARFTRAARRTVRTSATFR